jgi:hypothetical protein
MSDPEKNDKGRGDILSPEFYETGGATRAQIARIRDEYLRNRIAEKRGLPHDATWEDINRASAETTRKLAARQLSMDFDTPWGKIIEEYKKRQ